MNLIYGTDKYFIGAVKFFDTNKDFGFIASNNCNIPLSKYNQDFYVCSESFIENEAKKEGKIVVFQVEKQDNGKKRAVNVRRFTKSDTDIQLALSYYGNHEYIKHKNNKKINLYSHLNTPLEMVAEKVKCIVEDDINRSPKKTAKHFKFFVEHYKQDEYSKDRYIFDRQFSKKEKSIWNSLLSIFTDEERLAVLNIYPTLVKYFNDVTLIKTWLEHKLNSESNLSDWQDVKNIFEYIPKECEEFAQQRIETLVDEKIKEVFEELSQRSDIFDDDLNFNESNIYCQKWDFGMHVDYGKHNAVYKLWSYLHLTPKEYYDEKAECLASVKTNRFRKNLNTFIEKQHDAYERNKFFSYLKKLSEDDIRSFKKEITSSITPILDNAIDEREYTRVIDYIKQLTIIGEDFFNSYKHKLLPLLKDTLKESLLNATSNNKSNFFSIYEHYTSIYKKTEKETIQQELIPTLKKSQSIHVLSMASSKYAWLSIEEALTLSEQIVSQWCYEDINRFVRNELNLFNHSLEFADIIIARAIELIGTIPLTHPFNGTPLIEHYSIHSSKEGNCSFLNDLKKLIPKGQCSPKWEGYIDSLPLNDLLILFENKVISSASKNFIELIINDISIDGVYIDKARWYSKPSLSNETYTMVLKTTTENLFPPIAKRLLSMNMTDENVALAVLLTELMQANKPNSNSDHDICRKWETNFTNQIQDFKKTNTINQRLAVIWWAVHSKTTTSSASLTEVFTILPPYLQIKIVKKLFKSMSEGKVHYTAESLYNLVSNGKNPTCFPLEIAFSYLKLREKDQSKTLNDNIMLKLLDGRDDTNEWIGIRSIMTQCSGRWSAKNIHDDISNRKRYSYFNGIISKAQDGKLRIFIPYNMVDKDGNIQNYNNKYYRHAKRLTQITYKENEYQVVNEQHGDSYYFDISYEVELFALARPFNFKYNGLENYIEFETEEEDNEEFCECRLSKRVDVCHNIAFYWCGNKPCFRQPIRFHTEDEWENYTILDFMRILGICPDYKNKNGEQTKFGHYIILSSYLKRFSKFYEHLKCRECGKLLKPSENITNFESKAVAKFSCSNKSCNQKDDVYLNHCFNKQRCNAIIDSRDSKQCPNEQYICPECGACCSTENFRHRISNLQMTGGQIRSGLIDFVENDLGHWEKKEYYCYKCGKRMDSKSDEYYVCPDCNTKYDHN